MVAAVLRGPGRVEVGPVAVPTVGPTDVLVAVDLCGVCGTDLHLVLEGWATPGTWQGHEWVGTVAEVGSAVRGWDRGDVVVGVPTWSCGECARCRAGRPSICDRRVPPGQTDECGAFATYTVTPASSLRAVPAGLDRRAAALAEPLAVALHAVTRAGEGTAGRAMVLGAGPVGALVVAVLAASGTPEIVCVEPNEARRALAARLGATRVLAPTELDVPSIAEPSRIVDGAVDVVLECSGRAPAMEAGLTQLVTGGTLVLVGSGIEPPRLDPNRIVLCEVVVTGAFNYDDDGFDRALAMLATGAIPVDEVLEPGVVALDGLIDAMRGLAEGRVAGKVLVRP